jgi:hypothetical protein
MKKYLIEIRSNTGSALAVSINGDTPSCPFSIGGNLWAYMTPWNAARRLEKIAQEWEKRGRNVDRIFGHVYDMPKKGNINNTIATLNEWNK